MSDSLDYENSIEDLHKSEKDLEELAEVGDIETEVLLLEQLEYILENYESDEDAIDVLKKTLV